MINNRQGGRRRGRGGQRPQGMAGNSGNNARDSRQRGNAAQLLEKYKSMARDAQLAGDRVQTEYYLQFADHYFRVLGESRVRFDEQRRQRGDDDVDDDGDDEQMDNDAEAYADGESDAEEPSQQRQRARPNNVRPEEGERTERAERTPRRERPNGRAASADRQGHSGERIDFAVLPPAIGADDNGSSASSIEDEAPRRPRRERRPRADDTGTTEAAAD